jgi:outer membrane protein insertion porin family
MQRFLLRLSVTVMAVLVSVFSIQAQEADTLNPTSADPRLLEWKNSKIPKEYTIADVQITGIKYLDTSIVYSITNLQVGDKFVHPGADIFAKAIAALWRQKFFSGVQVYVTKLQDNSECCGTAPPR